MARGKAAKGKKGKGGGVQWARAWGERTGHALRPVLPLLFLASVYILAAVALWLPVRNDQKAVLTQDRLLMPILNTKRQPWISEMA